MESIESVIPNIEKLKKTYELVRKITDQDMRNHIKVDKYVFIRGRVRLEVVIKMHTTVPPLKWAYFVYVDDELRANIRYILDTDDVATTLMVVRKLIKETVTEFVVRP